MQTLPRPRVHCITIQFYFRQHHSINPFLLNACQFKKISACVPELMTGSVAHSGSCYTVCMAVSSCTIRRYFRAANLGKVSLVIEVPHILILLAKQNKQDTLLGGSQLPLGLLTKIYHLKHTTHSHTHTQSQNRMMQDCKTLTK